MENDEEEIRLFAKYCYIFLPFTQPNKQKQQALPGSGNNRIPDTAWGKHDRYMCAFVF
jgi:hypothetical protein